MYQFSKLYVLWLLILSAVEIFLIFIYDYDSFFSAICRASCGDGRCIRPNLCYCGNRQVSPSCDSTTGLIGTGGGGLPGTGNGNGGGAHPGVIHPGGDSGGAESVVIPGGGGGGGGGILPPQRSKYAI